MEIQKNFFYLIVLLLLIFRITALCFVAGLAVSYYLNLESFTPLGEVVKITKKERVEAALQLELDQNQSSQLISALYRERASLRQKSEEANEEIIILKNDLESMEPKIEEANSEREKLDKEVSEVIKLVEKSNEPLKKMEEENSPLFEKNKLLESKQSQVEDLLENLTTKAENLNGDLEALSEERRIAYANYESKKEEVLLSIKHPGHLYYGEEIEVGVAAVAPSGKGVFIDHGEAGGIKEGMIFIATDKDEQKKIPAIYRAKLVQEKFSFIEHETIGDSSKEIHAVEGEKLFLIRTGDSNTTDF